MAAIASVSIVMAPTSKTALSFMALSLVARVGDHDARPLRSRMTPSHTAIAGRRAQMANDARPPEVPPRSVLRRLSQCRLWRGPGHRVVERCFVDWVRSRG